MGRFNSGNFRYARPCVRAARRQLHATECVRLGRYAAPRADGETPSHRPGRWRSSPTARRSPLCRTRLDSGCDLIRPVAPFYEIWARVGDAGSAPETWRDIPLTPALLRASNGLALDALQMKVTAQNLKAARRRQTRILPSARFRL